MRIVLVTHLLYLLYYYTWQLCVTIPVWIYPGLRESSFSFVSRVNEEMTSQVDLKHCWKLALNLATTLRFWWLIIVFTVLAYPSSS